MGLERARGVEDRGFISAVCRGDGIAGDAWDSGLRVGNDDAVLDVVSADLTQCAAGGTCVGEELCHDGEYFVRIDGCARSVEGCVTHAVGVEVASVGIASAGVSGGGICSTAGISRTRCLGRGVARMCCVSS